MTIGPVHPHIPRRTGVSPRTAVKEHPPGMRDQVTLSGGKAAAFTPSRILPHIAVGNSTDREAMKQAMRAWPQLTAVVGVGQSDGRQTRITVASRPGAVGKNRLEGIYEIVQRLASSDLVKEQARAYPSEFHTVRPLDSRGTLHELRLPGPQSAASVEALLADGGQWNRNDQVRRLIHELPRGRRVAVLIAGPSAAGKSTLIREIQQYAAEVGRKVVALQGDMYFKDVDTPGYPKTRRGTHYWDHVDFMDMDRFKSDIGQLIAKGCADTPVYNFQDVRPGGWRIPGINVTGYREPESRRLELGPEDILVIDSLHAANSEVVEHLRKLGLPHRTIYLDSPRADDRLLRRIVRDYARRGGRMPAETLDIWDLTTWPGEKEFVRPTILNLDPDQDVFLITHFPDDLGLSREEMEARAVLLDQYGLAPTYEAFRVPEGELPALARAEEKRLEQVLASPEAGEREKATAKRELERLRSAPRYAA